MEVVLFLYFFKRQLFGVVTEAIRNDLGECLTVLVSGYKSIFPFFSVVYFRLRYINHVNHSRLRLQRCVVYSTAFSLFENVVKHGLSCLM